MPEENPIADVGIGGRMGDSAGPANSRASVGMFACRFRWVICAIASVAGIGGMVGAIGGMLIAEIVGHALHWTNSYMIPFFVAASAYLIALLLIHTLSPRLEPAVIGQG
jgi:nitrate/nitrite transporter NarK